MDWLRGGICLILGEHLMADDHFIGKTLDFLGIPAYKTMNLLLGVGNIKMKGVLLGRVLVS